MDRELQKRVQHTEEEIIAVILIILDFHGALNALIPATKDKCRFSLEVIMPPKNVTSNTKCRIYSLEPGTPV